MILENKRGYTQLYFLTITLKPICYKLDIINQYKLCIEQLYGILAGYEYLIIPELTKSYNIHMHGVIRLPMQSLHRKHTVQRTVTDLFRRNKIIGYINVQQVMDYNKCMCYILKEIENTYNELDMLLVEQPYGICDNPMTNKINIELNNMEFDYNDYLYFKQLKEKLD